MPTQSLGENLLIQMLLPGLEEASAGNPLELDDRCCAALRMLLQLKCSPVAVAGLLEQFFKVDPELINYLTAPIIVGKTVPHWEELLPTWLYSAITLSRFDRICQEHRQGKPSKLATPAEAVAVLYPASHAAPLTSNWIDVYAWCMRQLLGYRAGDMSGEIPAGAIEEWWKIVGCRPLEYEQVRYNFERLAATIRSVALKEMGKKRKKSEYPRFYYSVPTSADPDILLIFN